MIDNVIHINLDAKCKKCGKGGATQCGLCLKCVADALVRDIKKRKRIK